MLSLAIMTAHEVAAADSGIAGKYPHDVGIAEDPAVVFTESFDEGSLDEVISNWEEAQWPENMSFSSDVPESSGGQSSLHANGVAALYRRLLPGFDELYFRFYVKIDPACVQIHHWPWLGGRNPPTEYPFPQAGLQPNGDDRFSTGVEPMAADLAWDFYTYWKDMGCGPDGMCWGNTFNRQNGGNTGSEFVVEKGKWTSVELMVKMNQPASAHNGEQAFWIDGELKSHVKPGQPIGTWVWDKFVPDPAGEPFPGFQWRTVDELVINYVWLEHFVDTDPTCQAWFDDVVVAKEYIGPMVTTLQPPPAGDAGTGTGGTGAGGSASGTGSAPSAGAGSGASTGGGVPSAASESGGCSFSDRARTNSGLAFFAAAIIVLRSRRSKRTAVVGFALPWILQTSTKRRPPSPSAARPKNTSGS